MRVEPRVAGGPLPPSIMRTYQRVRDLNELNELKQVCITPIKHFYFKVNYRRRYVIYTLYFLLSCLN